MSRDSGENTPLCSTKNLKFYFHYYHHYQNVLPKGRSFTASAGTKVAVLLKAGLPSQSQEPRLQFCPKAGIPLQTHKPRLQFCPKTGLPL